MIIARKEKMQIGKREISKLEATLLVSLVATIAALAAVTIFTSNTMGGTYNPTLAVSVASASYSINGGGQIPISANGNTLTFPTDIMFNSTSDYINITVTVNNGGSESVPFSVTAPGSNINIAGFTVNGLSPGDPGFIRNFAPGTTTLSWRLEANYNEFGSPPGPVDFTAPWSFGPVQITSP